MMLDKLIEELQEKRNNIGHDVPVAFSTKDAFLFPMSTGYLPWHGVTTKYDDNHQPVQDYSGVEVVYIS